MTDVSPQCLQIEGLQSTDDEESFDTVEIQRAKSADTDEGSFYSDNKFVEVEALVPFPHPPQPEGSIESVLAALKAHGISPDLSSWCDRACVIRFLRAENGNVAKVVKRMLVTMEWRNKTHPENVVCQACIKNHRAHDLRLIDSDRYGRPVLYNCFRCCDAREPTVLLAHFTQEIERAIAVMQAPVETIVWICDFEGFGMRDAMDPRFSVSLINMFQTHYPERLGAIVCLDAPRLFSGLWSLAKRLLSPSTQRKIYFARLLDIIRVTC
mmetsp:Transcript_9924/g.33145  ORF Transcript_9924/g.33145 Transcript_9924/m.33145 type:complete len:268 (-) Transcript_9924:237-1040(-)